MITVIRKSRVLRPVLASHQVHTIELETEEAPRTMPDTRSTWLERTSAVVVAAAAPPPPPPLPSILPPPELITTTTATSARSSLGVHLRHKPLCPQPVKALVVQCRDLFFCCDGRGRSSVASCQNECQKEASHAHSSASHEGGGGRGERGRVCRQTGLRVRIWRPRLWLRKRQFSWSVQHIFWTCIC